MLVHPAALQCSNAGAALFKDVVTLEHFQKCVQLVRPADEFKHHAVRGKINDLCFADALQQKGPTWIECIIDKDEKVLPMIPGGGDINDIIME